MPPKKDNNNAAAAATAAVAAADIAAAEQKQALYSANAKLCRLVKRCPWMYDRQHPNYAKKQIMDKSWAKIAKDCDDSVASCKERWRNIRAAFARSINIYKTNSGPNRVKPYYLHSELKFLIQPMMDGRELSTKELDEIKADLDETTTLHPEPEECSVTAHLETSLPEAASDAEAEFDFAEDTVSPVEPCNNTTTPNNDSNDTTTTTSSSNIKTTNGKRRSIEHSSAEMTVSHVKCQRITQDFATDATPVTTDPDAKFLEALLPDMRAMNARQKIVFKRKIYQSLEEVFETNADFPQFTSTPFASSAGNSSSRLAAVATRSATQTVTSSIASLKENEMKKLQEFLEHIFQQRTNGNASQNGVSMRHCNGQTLTVIPRAAANQRGAPQGNNTVAGRNAASARNGGSWEQLQPITIKYELIDDEDDADVDDFE